VFRKIIIFACALLLCAYACAETQYDEIRYMGHGYSAVSVNGKWGVTDAGGKIVLPPQNEIVYLEDDGTLHYLQKGNVHSLHLNLSATAVPNLDADASSSTPVPSASPAPTPTPTPLSAGEEFSIEDYKPFTGSKVAKLSGKPTLEKRASKKYGHPRLDGAEKLFPVYAAIVEAVYPDDTRYSDPDWDAAAGDETLITCTDTDRAYQRLIEGTADIIFCPAPSPAQQQAAKSAGLELEPTPFGSEKSGSAEDVYMITRKGEKNPNVPALINWILSPQGRELIEKSGFAALAE